MIRVKIAKQKCQELEMMYSNIRFVQNIRTLAQLNNNSKSGLKLAVKCKNKRVRLVFLDRQVLFVNK